MAGVATGGGSAQLLEAEVVHIRRDTGESLGKVLEGVLDVSHARSLPSLWPVAATGSRRGAATVILSAGQQAR